MKTFGIRLIALVYVCWIPATLFAAELIEPEYLQKQVSTGALPVISQRVPAEPLVATFNEVQQTGKYGGTMRLLMGRSKDIRLMMVYGYGRLVGYNPELELIPDILKDFEVEAGRKFTFHLRKGHKWSDGEPFTTEAFRYYWEDIVNNEELYPFGLPGALLVDQKPPTVEIIDEQTLSYTWEQPNPFFLPALAAPRPLFLYAPAHYLKQVHASYSDPDVLASMVEDAGTRNWAGLHHRRNHPYKNDNPDLPTLQPWINTTYPPSERFVFKRNPFYHRIDEAGHQLPYIDEVTMQITSSSLVAAKASAGESDLQGRYIRLDNYTFLKGAEERGDYKVRLWQSGAGSKYALYPNLNSSNPTWRKLVRNRDFRRALSIGIDRQEINQVIYLGLAQATSNTVLESCPLYKSEYQNAWSHFNTEEANQLLDQLGLDQRDNRGIRLMEDGEPIEIILHTAGEGTEETDVLELIGESWRKLGIMLFTKPSQREVFRERVFSGNAMMAMFNGIDNGLPTADMSPEEFAPTNQTQLQWPKWGQHFETNRKVGEEPDIAEAQKLLNLYFNWSKSETKEDREAIWHQMLKIYSEEVFSIGLICGVPQPVVVNNRLRNVPEKGVYSWAPTAFFGVYRPDTFWFD
ncbi:MAG: ABC transporter substrate-binding protein [bacterium]